MINIIMFHKEEDILKLTGLDDRSVLWDVGFNLDDWDVGFCCDQKLHESIERIDEKNGEKHESVIWTDEGYWLGVRMEMYYYGFNYCEYRGKHYYTVHHS